MFYLLWIIVYFWIIILLFMFAAPTTIVPSLLLHFPLHRFFKASASHGFYPHYNIQLPVVIKAGLLR